LLTTLLYNSYTFWKSSFEIEYKYVEAEKQDKPLKCKLEEKRIRE